MNIVVVDNLDRVYCRPDTTLEREDKPLFVPDSVGAYMYAPVIFLKVSKAGKCVGEKFAPRYYESIGWGLLLYDASLLDQGLAFASCEDRLSILPGPLYTKHTLESPDNTFELRKDGEIIYSAKASDIESGRLEKALSSASQRVSLRIGDYLAVELAPLERLAGKEEKEITLSGSWCGNPLFDFPVIF
ncbi:MAG: hypothetical protein MJY67_05715 [Bacteroidales bacterium]|nr:hypothetical protein [Bacteroidales bacterium]